MSTPSRSAIKACRLKPISSRNSSSEATSRISLAWVLSSVMVSSLGPRTWSLAAASVEGSEVSEPCDSSLFSLIVENRSGADVMKKRMAASSASEPVNGVVGEGCVEGLFAHGQHEIFGIGHDGGPGGVGSGRGDGGTLSWRRGFRDERTGAKRKPSSWNGGGLRR